VIRVDNISIGDIVIQGADYAESGDIFIVTCDRWECPLIYMLVIDSGSNGILVCLHRGNHMLGKLCFKSKERYYWFDKEEIKRGIIEEMSIKPGDIKVRHVSKRRFKVVFTDND
jgi:hypothetical protein